MSTRTPDPKRASDQTAERALSVLRQEPRAEPSPDFAARAAAHALSRPRQDTAPSDPLAGFVASILAMARPAAALACATAVVLGIVSAQTSPRGTSLEAASTVASSSVPALIALDVDDAFAAVLPFSVSGVGGSG